MKVFIRHPKGWGALALALAVLASVPLLAAAPSSSSPPAVASAHEPPSGQRTAVWLVLRSKADLSAAYGIKDWAARGRFVTQQLQTVAQNSQTNLRNELTRRGLKYQSAWIINAIRVDADATTTKELSNHPDVERVVRDVRFQIPKPLTGPAAAHPTAIEWNISRIRAPEVWASLGTRGEGITVGSIDTGTQFDHPALARQYRGLQPDGSVDHNYNWYDPSLVCGNPSLVPCDNVGHGTHTMGTMVGDDGNPGENQIGVAPGVRWMTAKGCEDLSCSTSALLAAGQWMLAPTDLSGNNPRPELRPQVINNSWGDGPTDPVFQPIVQAWIAAGIFPVFSNGNDGDFGCGTSGIPGAYPESYSVGAFDINDAIASFSGRGPSAFGVTKPDVAAPGVDVRSSVPGGGYESWGGTSMAAPHVAATVALMWSAAPSLMGDVAATRSLLDAAAVDREDLSCGGAPGDNNVWGEGALDAFRAVELSPRGPTGLLTGAVTDAATGAALPGVRIAVTGPSERATITDDVGRYSFVLPVGTYTVSANLFGYGTVTVAGVVVSEGGTVTQDFSLAQVPSHAVAGRVTDPAGTPVPGATVTVLATPLLPVTTGTDGRYRFDQVPEGTYDIRVEAGGCFEPLTRTLTVDGNETLDFMLSGRSDAFGYFCRLQSPSYVDATTVVPLSGIEASIELPLPFLFTFYGETYERVFVSTNGVLNFLAHNVDYINTPLPNVALPNAAIYPFWDDLYVDSEASVRTLTRGVAPTRQFVIEWRNVTFYSDQTSRVSFEVVLSENGEVLMQYRDIGDSSLERGGSATVGIENESGTVALMTSFNTPAVSAERAILFDLPPNGIVQGVVRNANDGLPVADATVRALRGGSVFRSATTNAQGRYRLQLPLGTYGLAVSAVNYETESGGVRLSVDDEVVNRDWTLRTARAVVSPPVLEFIVPAGQRRVRTLTLSNTGSAPLRWELAEAGGQQMQPTPLHARVRDAKAEPNGPTARRMMGLAATPGWAASLTGEVLRNWTATGLDVPWGVGYTQNVWVSDAVQRLNHEFTVEGAATGLTWAAPWSGEWPADMAYDAARGLMCQLAVGGDNGIHCWNPLTGEEVDSITGPFAWTGISQRGLAYRPDDDTFYVGGWNEGIIYHVQGLSHPDRGAVLGQCSPPDGAISGLAWNGSFGVLWAATNSPTDTIYELNPATCTVLNTLAHPSPGYNGGGLEMDAQGNLWMVAQGTRQVYLIESGVPAFTDVPWLSERPRRGTLAPGRTQEIAVTVDTTGLAPGVYQATVFVRTNSGRQPLLQTRISLIVPAYQQAVNSGGATFVDHLADRWAADQRYRQGGWGFLEPSERVATPRPIAGTVDDPLYQRARRGFVEYRFDNLPPGVYQLELRFAEIQDQPRLRRVYDVVAETQLVLPAHDIANEVGQLTADDHSFFLTVTDGQLNLRLVPRDGFGVPLINAIRVTQRPDR
ncbi:S8A family peptidase [Corallococcus coralloides]|uniref:S8A family peptidase n=1 Tax=Corallococcus coralloides TaxID=184914 RepID=A0A410RPK8_CORCK|nr:carboxypeptidase regulatory-like domain-containing protein [Corallococcus coralloides]QAT83776.1 S8A family peptidase [Corallococcus coralloides]